jgi:hypothetical protein
MKQSAVDWQFEQLFNSFEKFNNGECTFDEYLKRNLEIREQAKEMEKQQIIDARVNGVAEGIEISDKTITKDISKNHEIYYNETFKKK